MKFKLTIDCDNAAFEPEVEGAAKYEVARILRQVSDRLVVDGDDWFIVGDINGNGVGIAKFTRDDEVDDREFLQPDDDEELS